MRERRSEAEDLPDGLRDFLAEIVLPIAHGLIAVIRRIFDVGAVLRTWDRRQRELRLVVLVARDRAPLGGEISVRRLDDALDHAGWRIPRIRRRRLVPAIEIELGPRPRGETTTPSIAAGGSGRGEAAPGPGHQTWPG